MLEIYFSHELAITGKHVLLVEGLVHSGVTTEFLMSDLRARGAASVKLVTSSTASPRAAFRSSPTTSASWSTMISSVDMVPKIYGTNQRIIAISGGELRNLSVLTRRVIQP